jgi:mannose-6-phosphate isomerase
MLCSVLEGSGDIVIGDETFSIEKGEHFILPAELGDFAVKGQVQLIVLHR